MLISSVAMLHVGAGAILVATVLDVEARLTDAVLDMADKLIGGLFAKARMPGAVAMKPAPAMSAG